MTGLYSIQQLIYYEMFFFLQHVAPFHKLFTLRSLLYCNQGWKLINMHVTFEPYNFKEDT